MAALTLIDFLSLYSKGGAVKHMVEFEAQADEWRPYTYPVVQTMLKKSSIVQDLAQFRQIFSADTGYTFALYEVNAAASMQFRLSECDSACPDRHRGAIYPHRRRVRVVEMTDEQAQAYAEMGQTMAREARQESCALIGLTVADQTRLQELTSEFYNCSMCLATADELRCTKTSLCFLPCLHSFCFDCTSAYKHTRHGHTGPCPLCRAVHNMTTLKINPYF